MARSRCTLPVALALALAGTACGGSSSASGATPPPPTACDAQTTCSGHGTCTTLGDGSAGCACAAAYAGADCAACAADHVDEGAGCIHERAVACADAAPADATSIPSTVTVTYATGAGWSAPARCAFTCNVDHDAVGGACLDARQVSCADVAPPDATSIASTVTITYTTAGGWTAPAPCAWTCAGARHREGDACVADVDLSGAWCTIQYPPSILAQVGTPTLVYGQIHTAATEGAGQAPGILARLCHGPWPLVDPPGVGALACVDAVYNAAAAPGLNDEYQAALDPGTPGTYGYVYAFSGNGGASWLACDTAGVAGNPSQPGVATITPRATLLFSEYVEGSASNKALEIANDTGSAVDLSACAIRTYLNGATTPTTAALSGTLASGDVLVVCNASASAALLVACDRLDASAALAFTGDDAVELSCAGATVDVIGQIGVDPGTTWGTAGGVATADRTLRRHCAVVQGDANGADAFDPAAEWDGFAVDTFGGLGVRGCP